MLLTFANSVLISTLLLPSMVLALSDESCKPLNSSGLSGEALSVSIVLPWVISLSSDVSLISFFEISIVLSLDSSSFEDSTASTSTTFSFSETISASGVSEFGFL